MRCTLQYKKSESTINVAPGNEIKISNNNTREEEMVIILPTNFDGIDTHTHTKKKK